MDKVLENLGSGSLGEKVLSPCPSPCSLDPSISRVFCGFFGIDLGAF